MSWWRTLTNPVSWYFWTVAGIATRHGIRGVPRKDEYSQMETPNAEVQRVGDLLEEIRKVRGDGASPLPVSKTQSHDFERAVASLRGALRDQGIDHERLDDDEASALVRIMAALRAAETRAPAPVGARDRLSLIEAEWIKLTDRETSRLRERWHERKNSLESHAARVKHHLGELFDHYAVVHERHKKKDLQEPHTMVPARFYWPLMTLIGILELPFNATAFQILREPNPRGLFLFKPSFWLPIGPSVAIVLLAHFLGTTIRQWPEEKGHWKVWLIAIVSLFSLVAGLLTVGYLRGEFVAHLEHKSAVQLMDILPFLGINLICLAAGICAAYFAHDPDRELERICHEKHRLRRAMHRTWKEWTRWSGEFDKLRGRLIERVNALRQGTLARIQEYRAYNAPARAEGTTPDWFREDPTERFFKPVDFEDELEHAPGSLNEMIRRIEGGEVKNPLPIR